MIPCVWYVSKTVDVWRRALIGRMAESLRSRGVPLSLYVDGSVAGIDARDVSAWSALTGLERASRILFSGRALWHLWGNAPAWWRIVRLRARAVHTSFDEKTSWCGYPSRLFPDRARDGESLILPAFDFRISGVDDEGPLPVVCLGDAAGQGLEDALSGNEHPVVGADDLSPDAPTARSGVFIAGPQPFDALRAASLTMQGLVAAAIESPHLNALLGSEGYVRAAEDTEEAWRLALEAALSERGRAVAVSARHFIKTRCSPERSADSLVALYSSALGGSVLP